jgi:hypothetical protein
MDKKFWISGIAATLVTFASGFVVHGLILAGDYKPLMGNLMRTEEGAMGLFHFMVLAHIIMGFGAAWIYRQGVTEGAWLTQGVRFGIAAAAISVIPMYMIFYVVQPTAGMLAVKQIIFDTISWVIVGIVLAVINKK